MLSPTVKWACPEEQLTLTCIANPSQSSHLTWTVSLPGENLTEIRNVPLDGDGELILKSFRDNPFNVTFNFMRASKNETHPLQSELQIDRVDVNINGTRINCLRPNDPDPNITFIIHVKGGN